MISSTLFSGGSEIWVEPQEDHHNGWIQVGTRQRTHMLANVQRPGQAECHLRDPSTVPFGLMVAQFHRPRPPLDGRVVGKGQFQIGAMQVLERPGAVDGNGRLPGEGLQEL